MTKSVASSDIQFRDVWFKYPNSEEWTLKGFSINIKAGEKIGFYGDKGSGKTTLVGLLLRLYDPQRGYISVGGIPITQFSLQTLRTNFGVVFEKPQLMNRSILSNLVYGRPEANLKEIREKSSVANLKELLNEEALPADQSNSRRSSLPIAFEAE